MALTEILKDLEATKKTLSEMQKGHLCGNNVAYIWQTLFLRDKVQMCVQLNLFSSHVIHFYCSCFPTLVRQLQKAPAALAAHDLFSECVDTSA